jgi:hypothetical protein
MEWLGFWIFASVFLVCDTWLFSKGYNSFFWDWKTSEEQQLRKKAIEGCDE